MNAWAKSGFEGSAERAQAIHDNSYSFAISDTGVRSVRSFYDYETMTMNLHVIRMSLILVNISTFEIKRDWAYNQQIKTTREQNDISTIVNLSFPVAPHIPHGRLRSSVTSNDKPLHFKETRRSVLHFCMKVLDLFRHVVLALSSRFSKFFNLSPRQCRPRSILPVSSPFRALQHLAFFFRNSHELFSVFFFGIS